MEEGENEGTVFTWCVPLCSKRALLRPCFVHRYQQPPDGKYYFELYRDNFYEFDNKACLPKVAGNFRLRSGIIADQKTKASPAKGMLILASSRGNPIQHSDEL